MPGVKSRRTAGTLLIICCIISTIFNAINLGNIINNTSAYAVTSMSMIFVIRALFALAGELLIAIGILGWKAVLIRVGCGISIAYSAFTLVGYITAPYVSVLDCLVPLISMTISIIMILISVRSSRMGGLKYVPGILQTVLFAIIIITYAGNGSFERYGEYINMLFEGLLSGAMVVELLAFTGVLVMQVLYVIAMWFAGVGLINSKQVKANPYN